MEKFGYLSQSNSDYIDQLYQQYRKDPQNVDQEWRRFFEGMEFTDGRATDGFSETELKVYRLIQGYQDYGHFEARLNPLNNSREKSQTLSLHRYGLSESDFDTVFDMGPYQGTLREIIEQLRKRYCDTLSVQVAGTKDNVRQWFIEEMESDEKNFQINKDQKISILNQVIRTECFEKFLHTRYVGMKRFSIEGADAMIAMLEQHIVTGRRLGLEETVIGMAHRGRLNVLANFMGKAFEDIFAKFEGHEELIEPGLDGDVKYHLGYSSDRETPYGNHHVSLAFNPSHLEAVDPVACGMTRAKQRQYNDTQERKKVVPILIHGDSAVAGQGVVTETLQQSQLKGYTVGGTIHIVVDNQLGFTADPEDTRSSPYASDISKVLLAPVIHVNGDDVEACVRAMDMATRFRQEFGMDVFINLICYRRYGHNEADEPSFTQPQMYLIIKKHPTLTEIYAKKLISEGVVDQKYVDNLVQEKLDQLQSILDATRDKPPQNEPLAFQGVWKGLRRGTLKDFEKSVNTKVKLEDLKKAGEILTTFPQGFQPHNKIKKLLEQRAQMIAGEKPIDWGMGELLCYGSLIIEGISVRLSGQDSGRGTFSHRHSIIYDKNSGEPYIPLKHLNPEKEFCVYDSLLSEMAVLGFEYGNSISDPTFLTIWEAQFGDFANGAQIMIDQFISSGESKWYRSSGLVLLLPHGYEGQGPEHSSARLERFLQLCGQANMQVCSLTSPSQLFHVLRRQVKRDFRKPLVIMSPKSLLRHPKVTSEVSELTDGSFYEVIEDPKVKQWGKVETAVFCTGKVFFDLDDYRDKNKVPATKVSIHRIEQLYPLSEKKIKVILEKCENLKRVVWLQEEPQNMGAYTELAPRFEKLIEELGLEVEFKYIGRTRRASPAAGTLQQHNEEQEKIVKECFKYSR